MFQKIKRSVLLTLAGLTLMAPGLVPAMASASINSSLCTGVNAAATGSGSGTCTTSGDGSNSIQKIASNIVNIFSLVVGAIAIVMIIYGGFKYITSGGDSGNVSSAKNTLIYAIVGLIIVALAQFIVHFVLTATNNAVPTQ